MTGIIKRILDYPELEKEIKILERENRTLHYQKTKYKNELKRLTKQKKQDKQNE